MFVTKDFTGENVWTIAFFSIGIKALGCHDN